MKASSLSETIFRRLIILLAIFGILLPFFEVLDKWYSSSYPADKVSLWTASLKPYFTDYVNGMITDFQTGTGYEVLWTDVPLSAISQKFLSATLSGDTPDLVNLDLNWTYTFYWKGALSEIRGDLRNNYLPQLLKALTVRGKLIAIPWYINLKVTICNKALLDEMGLKPPKTYEDLMRMIYTSKEGKWGFWYFIKFEQDLQALTGRFGLSRRYIDYSQPGTVKLLRSLRKAYLRGALPEGFAEGGYADAIALFLSGQVGCIIIGPQFIYRVKREAPEIYANLIVERLPYERPPITMMTLAIPSGKEDSRYYKAKLLAEFITSTEYQLKLSELAPVLPSTVDGLNSILRKCRRNNLDVLSPEEKARCLTAEDALRGEVYELKLPAARWRSKLYKTALRKAVIQGEDPREVLQDLSERISSDPRISTALEKISER